MGKDLNFLDVGYCNLRVCLEVGHTTQMAISIGHMVINQWLTHGLGVPHVQTISLYDIDAVGGQLEVSLALGLSPSSSSCNARSTSCTDWRPLPTEFLMIYQ